jgi:hypothetical protein
MFLDPAGCERLANGGNGRLPHANGRNIFSFHHRNVDRPVQFVRQLILQECSRQPPCRPTADNYNPHTPVHLNTTCLQAHYGPPDYSQILPKDQGLKVQLYTKIQPPKSAFSEEDCAANFDIRIPQSKRGVSHTYTIAGPVVRQWLSGD